MGYFYSFYVLLYFAYGAFFTLFALYMDQTLAFNQSQIGLILSVQPLVAIFIPTVFAAFADKYQKTKGIVMALLVSVSLVVLVLSRMESFIPFLLVYIVYSIVNTPISPMSDAMTVHALNEMGGIPFGKVRLFGSVGFAFAGYSVASLADHYGLVILFYAMAVCLLLSTFSMSKIPAYVSADRIEIKRYIKRLMVNKNYMFTLLYSFLFFMTLFGSDPFLNLYIVERGISVTNVGLLLMVSVLVEIPMMLFANKWIGKIGMKKVLFFVALGSTIRLASLYVASDFTAFLLIGVLRGAVVGIAVPSIVQYIYNITEKEVRATAITFYTAVSVGLGQMLGNMISGSISQFSSYGFMFLMFSLLSGLTVLVSLKMTTAEHL